MNFRSCLLFSLSWRLPRIPGLHTNSTPPDVKRVALSLSCSVVLQQWKKPCPWKTSDVRAITADQLFFLTCWMQARCAHALTRSTSIIPQTGAWCSSASLSLKHISLDPKSMMVLLWWQYRALYGWMHSPSWLGTSAGTWLECTRYLNRYPFKFASLYSTKQLPLGRLYIKGERKKITPPKTWGHSGLWKVFLCVRCTQPN